MTEKELASRVARELSIGTGQISKLADLLDGGATVPFIARYRQEVTGGLDEQQIRDVRDRLESIRALEQRREFILESIESQGRLTDELRKSILGCHDLTQLEDLYLPYKPRKMTRADKAIEAGLEPLADLIWEQELIRGEIESIAQAYVDEEKGISTIEEACKGARDIVAQRVSQDPEVREMLRKQLRTYGTVTAKLSSEKARAKDGKKVFETYYDFQSKVKHLKPYQVLALDRGEREGVLRVRIEVWEERTLEEIDKLVIRNEKSLFVEDLEEAITDAWKRLLSPSLERELRSELTDQSGEHAIGMFAENLKNLLLQPPLASRVVMGIDPAYRTGCKVAVVGATGNYLEGTTIWPTPPRNQVEEAKRTMAQLIEKHHVDLIAIGNGTASRETEQVVAELVRSLKERGKANGLSWLIVNEAGASVYSASDLAREEFPDLEAAQRGNISIARRVLDPLAELVKIDPKSIGVGLYQHDVSQVKLGRKLDEVVESCVNHVGVHLNSASAALLNYVSGLGRLISKEIVRHRESIGRFTSREQLLEVAGLGPFRFEQAAGFLRIPESENPLDNTAIHPESYHATEALCRELNLSVEQVAGDSDVLRRALEGVKPDSLAGRIGVGRPTLELIIENLLKPGRDPREEMDPPALREDILTMEDLAPGQKLKGTVRNVVDFGAFVDIGVKADGLLHVSKMRSDGKRVQNVLDEVRVGEVIDVAIESVDVQRQRIGLKRV
ncbi:MAG: Tex family protein [Bacteroidota bacterium]